jgi:hypothetical protein
MQVLLFKETFYGEYSSGRALMTAVIGFPSKNFVYFI